jgi:hypothetical protein
VPELGVVRGTARFAALATAGTAGTVALTDGTRGDFRALARPATAARFVVRVTARERVRLASRVALADRPPVAFVEVLVADSFAVLLAAGRDARFVRAVARGVELPFVRRPAAAARLRASRAALAAFGVAVVGALFRFAIPRLQSSGE